MMEQDLSLTLRPQTYNTSRTMLTQSFAGIDYLAQKEGMSAALDPEINNLANDAINKF